MMQHAGNAPVNAATPSAKLPFAGLRMGSAGRGRGSLVLLTACLASQWVTLSQKVRWESNWGRQPASASGSTCTLCPPHTCEPAYMYTSKHAHSYVFTWTCPQMISAVRIEDSFPGSAFLFSMSWVDVPKRGEKDTKDVDRSVSELWGQAHRVPETWPDSRAQLTDGQCLRRRNNLSRNHRHSGQIQYWSLYKHRLLSW